MVTPLRSLALVLVLLAVRGPGAAWAAGAAGKRDATVAQDGVDRELAELLAGERRQADLARRRGEPRAAQRGVAGL